MPSPLDIAADQLAPSSTPDVTPGPGDLDSAFASALPDHPVVQALTAAKEKGVTDLAHQHIQRYAQQTGSPVTPDIVQIFHDQARHEHGLPSGMERTAQVQQQQNAEEGAATNPIQNFGKGFRDVGVNLQTAGQMLWPGGVTPEQSSATQQYQQQAAEEGPSLARATGQTLGSIAPLALPGGAGLETAGLGLTMALPRTQNLAEQGVNPYAAAGRAGLETGAMAGIGRIAMPSIAGNVAAQSTAMAIGRQAIVGAGQGVLNTGAQQAIDKTAQAMGTNAAPEQAELGPDALAWGLMKGAGAHGERTRAISSDFANESNKTQDTIDAQRATVQNDAREAQKQFAAARNILRATPVTDEAAYAAAHQALSTAREARDAAVQRAQDPTQWGTSAPAVEPTINPEVSNESSASQLPTPSGTVETPSTPGAAAPEYGAAPREHGAAVGDVAGRSGGELAGGSNGVPSAGTSRRGNRTTTGNTANVEEISTPRSSAPRQEVERQNGERGAEAPVERPSNQLPSQEIGHLSPEAQQYFREQTPEMQEKLRSTVEHRRNQIDRAGDLGNIQQHVQLEGEIRARKIRSNKTENGGEGHAGERSENARGEDIQRNPEAGKPNAELVRGERKEEGLTASRMRAQIASLPVEQSHPGHADVIMGFVEGRARAVGKTPDQWVGDRVKEVQNKSGVSRLANSAVRFVKDGRAIIKAFKGTNPSSVLHEMAHVFRRDLSPQEEATIAQHLGVPKNTDGTYAWGRKHEEAFARALERYHHEGGKAPEGMKPIFEKVTKWLREVYASVKGSPIEKDLTPEVRKFFDGIYGKGEEPKATEKVTSPTGHSLRVESEEGRKGVAKLREEIGAPETRHHAPLIAEAKKNVAENPQKVHDDIIAKARSGKMFTDADQFHAAELMDHYAKTEKGGVTSAKFREIGTADIITGGTETGRSLAARIDRFSSSSENRRLDAAARVSVPPPRVSRKISRLEGEIQTLHQKADTLFQKSAASIEARQLKARAKKKEELLARLKARDNTRYARDVKFFKRAGFDITDPNAAWLNDARQFENFIGAYNIRNEGWPAVAREIYINILHASGLVTGKKILADALGVGTYATQKHLEAAIAGGKRLIGREAREGEASAAELGTMYRALWPGVRRAADAFVYTMKTEQLPPHLMGPEDRLHFPAIQGKGGKILRFASLLTPVRMIDAFAKSIIAHLEAHSQAHRTAVDADGKRLTGEAYSNHMTNEVNNFDSPSWEKARNEAMYRTYTNVAVGAETLNKIKYGKPETAGGSAAKFAANVATPFYGIPTNIVTQGLRHWTPVVSDILTIGDHYKKGHITPNEVNEEAARAIMRLGAWGIVGTLASGGALTGEDDKVNPHTIKLLGKHFDYKYAGAPARAVAAAADWFAPFTKESEKVAKKEGETFATGQRIVKGTGEMLAEQPTIRFLTDIYSATQRTDGFWRLAADKLAVRPSIVSQTQNSQQEEVLARAYDKKAKAAERFWGYIKQRYTGNQGKPVKVDGKTLRKEAFDSGVGTELFRVLSPIPLGYRED